MNVYLHHSRGMIPPLAFIKCLNNNRAKIVLESFILATQEYGIPFRERSDHGGENAMSSWKTYVATIIALI